LRRAHPEAIHPKQLKWQRPLRAIDRMRRPRILLPSSNDGGVAE
jgi:hypothetical protein